MDSAQSNVCPQCLLEAAPDSSYCVNCGASLDKQAASPVRFDLEYPGELSRLLLFVKWLMAIPLYIVLFVLGFVAFILWFPATFMTLLTGAIPVGCLKRSRGT